MITKVDPCSIIRMKNCIKGVFAYFEDSKGETIKLELKSGSYELGGGSRSHLKLYRELSDLYFVESALLDCERAEEIAKMEFNTSTPDKVVSIEELKIIADMTVELAKISPDVFGSDLFAELLGAYSAHLSGNIYLPSNEKLN